MVGMKISEVARQAGIQPSTLRYYEEIGLLPQPQRVSGSRRYDESVLQRLAIIQTAQQAGFTLAEMRLLFDDILISSTPSMEWHDLVQRKLQELNVMLMNVQSMKNLLEDIMNCEAPQLAECIYSVGQKYK
jgi:MerR family transcriptional regulator, redox-sensitive transcriptional activator SoxR